MTTDTGEERNAESKKNVRCWLCHESHKVSDSQTLKNMSIQERRETVKRKGLCFNCLYCLLNTHQISNCKSKVSCKIKESGKRHNTILNNVSHKPPSNNTNSTADSQNKHQQENQQDQQVINSHSSTI